MTGATSANRDPRSAAPTFWLVLDERPERYHPFVLSFSAKTRAANLTRMAEDRFDVLVIGGGITGVGIALDAAARGFSVALVERDDFVSGTSGRSSRMIHGGLRYLEHYEFDLVNEALRERSVAGPRLRASSGAPLPAGAVAAGQPLGRRSRSYRSPAFWVPLEAKVHMRAIGSAGR